MIMKKSILFKSVALVAGLGIAYQCFSASPAIRSDRESECALYLCIPGGFQGDPCGKAKQAMIKRMTDVTYHGTPKYTAVPAFNFCKDNPPPEVQANLDKLGVKDSSINYVERYDSHIPQHQECTQFREEWICTNPKYAETNVKKCPREDLKKIRYCVAWKTIPEHYVNNAWCNLYRYNAMNSSYGSKSNEFIYDDKGQKIGSRNSPAWCDRTTRTVGVQVDGKIVGQEARY